MTRTPWWFPPVSKAPAVGTIPAAAESPHAGAIVGPRAPLVVDMDGALLATDVLAENVLAALFRHPRQLVAALAVLGRGRVAFEARVAQIAPLDVARLPVRGALAAFLRNETSTGRQIHLVTGGALHIAHAVAAHVGGFDGVHAGPETATLQGARKLAYLQALFPAGFAYVGDGRADLAIWREARSIVIAGATGPVAAAARRAGKPVEAEFDIGGASLESWRRAFRLHQWSKNLLVFAPLMLSYRVGEFRAWATCVIGFLILGVAASATYVINDLADLQTDRGHRTKRLRPLASGELPVRRALMAAMVMLAGALAAAAFLSVPFTIALVTYLAITLAYSLRLKRVALLDVMTLGVLYTIRLICGAALAGVVGSPWLLTFSAFFFFSMALAKRHVDVSTATSAPDQLLAGLGYRPMDAPLTLAMGVATSAAAVLIIVQYMVAEAFPSGVYAQPIVLWSAPVLLGLWVCRIWLVAHRGELDDDPVAFAVKDRISLALGAVLAVSFLLARY